jgi:hypothetical protein
MVADPVRVLTGQIGTHDRMNRTGMKPKDDPSIPTEPQLPRTWYVRGYYQKLYIKDALVPEPFQRHYRQPVTIV